MKKIYFLEKDRPGVGSDLKYVNDLATYRCEYMAFIPHPGNNILSSAY